MTNYELTTIFLGALTTLASLVAATGIFIASKQFKLSKKAYSAEHERARRELAIEVLKNWTKYLDKIETSARKFIEMLSIEDCKNIQKGCEMKVDIKYKKILTFALTNILSEDPLKVSDDKLYILLSETQVAELLNLSINHLNRLEISLLYHMNGVADKEIMEFQFEYLLNPKENYYILEEFRKAMGSKGAFPAIDNFVAIKKAKYLKDHPEARENVDF